MSRSQIRSYEQIPEDNLHVFTDRLIQSAYKYVSADRARWERRKLSPVLGKLINNGPAEIIEYLRPRKPYEHNRHPDWTGIEITTAKGLTYPTGIVTVRKNAELALADEGSGSLLECTIVGALSFRDDELALSGLFEAGVGVAAQISDLPIVGVEKSQPPTASLRGWKKLRNNATSNDAAVASAEEIALRGVMPELVFRGNIIRDDMNGLFVGAEHGAVYSTQIIPELTTPD